jgi:predicted nucleic acid-binding protein
MILVDSFGWIEYLIDGPLADKYEEYLKQPLQIITPTMVIYEVYKKIRRERREEEAITVLAQMKKTKVVPLTEEIALSAAELSLTYKLPLADSIVYATSIKEDVCVITSDPHFKGLNGVVFIEERDK